MREEIAAAVADAADAASCAVGAVVAEELRQQSIIDLGGHMARWA